MKKTRLILCLLSIFFLCFGLVLLIFSAAQMGSSTGRYYTWTPPYTDYEAAIIMTRVWGIVLIIIGGLSILASVISHIHETKNVQEINPSISHTVVCPTCGIKMDRSLTTCPKCKTILKK